MAELTEIQRLARVNLDHVIKKHPDNPQVLKISPRNLDDLKAWMGVPNAHVEAKHRTGWLKTVNREHLPDSGFDFSKLTAEQQQAVRDQAYNLLFGMVDEEMLSDPKIKGVVTFMMKEAKDLSVTVGGDVTVKDGEVYPITTPTASFNTLTIVGSGTLKLDQNTKVICDTLIYKPAT